MATTEELLKNSQTLLNRVKNEGVQGIPFDQISTPTTPITIPQEKVDTNFPSLGSITTGTTDTGESEMAKLLKQYLGSQEKPPSGVSAFEGATGQTSADMIQAETDAVKRQNQLQAQLTAINDELIVKNQQAKQEGISAGAMQGRNLAEERQAVLRALPISRDLAVAQGNTQLAQQRTNQLFQLQVKDAENAYNYRNKLIDSVYDYADKNQQRLLDQKKIENDQAFQLKRDEAARQHDIYMQGLKDKSAGLEDGFLSETDIKKIDLSPQGKSVKALGVLKQKIQNYKDLVTKFGTSSFGKQKAQLESAYADAKVAWKEAANLGALTGPDVGLIEEAIKPATNAWFGTQAWRNITGGGKDTILASLDTSLNTINQNAVSNIQQLYARDPRYASSLYVQEITNPFVNEITLSDTQIQEMTKDLSQEQIQQLKDEGLIP